MEQSSAVPSAAPPPIVADLLHEVSDENLRNIVETLVAFGTRHTLSETESPDRGIGAARRWIKAEFERYAAESGRAGDEKMRVWFDSHQYGPDRRRIPREVEIINVMAELPGSMPEARGRRYYVIGHYDSRASGALDAQTDSPGANDDASGVAVVMELARIMSQRRYDATIVFMATAGEEQGLIGTRLHANAARAEGLDIRAVLNNDMVGDPSAFDGRIIADRVRIFSEALPRNLSAEELARIRSLGAESDSDSRQLARFIFETAQWHNRNSPGRLPVEPMLIFRSDRFLRGGDHTVFNDAGYAAVRFTHVEENYDRQHQDIRVENGRQFGDLPEFIDDDFLAGVTRLNGAVLAHLANAPSAPTDARILTRLTHDTTIRWSRSPEPDVAGYEIVWRETTSPVWQYSRDVGDAIEATLDLNKDNFFFGVRAYDHDGYRSPVAFCGAAGR